MKLKKRYVIPAIPLLAFLLMFILTGTGLLPAWHKETLYTDLNSGRQRYLYKDYMGLKTREDISDSEFTKLLVKHNLINADKEPNWRFNYSYAYFPLAYEERCCGRGIQYECEKFALSIEIAELSLVKEKELVIQAAKLLKENQSYELRDLIQEMNRDEFYRSIQ